MRCGARPMVSRPSTSTEPERLPTRPSSALRVVVRPGAVAAEQGDDLAAVDVAVDPVQHVRLAVVGVQVAYPQQRRLHQCAPCSSPSGTPM